MATNWQRWLRYGKAKLDSTMRSADEELDRREARLEAEAADKPWLRSTGESPSLDEVRARIEHEAEQRRIDGSEPPAPHTADAGDPVIAPNDDSVDAATSGEAYDLAEQQRKADERLAAIRSELGLDQPEPPGNGKAPR